MKNSFANIIMCDVFIYLDDSNISRQDSSIYSKQDILGETSRAE